MIDLMEIAAALDGGRLADPFAWLGPHEEKGRRVVRTFQPLAERVSVHARDGRELARLTHVALGLFAGEVPDAGRDYVLRVGWPGGGVQETEDPYAFGAVLGDLDIYLFNEGRHRDMGRVFGAQPRVIDGVAGVAFSVWAPNARRVSVVGDFSNWDGRRLPMRLRYGSGLWEVFVPRLGPGAVYKFEVVGADGSVTQRADPIARAAELPPATGSIVAAAPDFAWTDGEWMASRAGRQAADAPVSIYEVHAGSWRRPEDGGVFDWDRLAAELVPYLKDMGFTHVELMPIMEHPFGGSWGYQPLGQFAPSSRYGRPEQFARFVDACHAAGIGVLLDWVPAHFPTDLHGLSRFDGTALYEHADPREGFHQDWNTAIYNLGRSEVSGFLLASAAWWLDAYHVDGLRVDAVASMLYRDYSRKAGEWVPNIHGGRENLESVEFLKQLNLLVAERGAGAITVAEESTAWPGVTAPVDQGGLGFTYKWNMGWMHDSLQYVERDPAHRGWHHDELTFSLVYAFSEKFVLPISHDEVVHGKGSLLGKMPGDQWRRFANLRAYLAFMWTHPGKKLLFMGCELAQPWEWNHDGELPFWMLRYPEHAGVQALVRSLNEIYVAEPALHTRDADPAGFGWIIGDDRANSVFAWVRYGPDGAAPVVCVLNMTPEPKQGYRVGLPIGGRWAVKLNTDADNFAGSGVGQMGELEADDVGLHGLPASAALGLPPLGLLVLRHQG